MTSLGRFLLGFFMVLCACDEQAEHSAEAAPSSTSDADSGPQGPARELSPDGAAVEPATDGGTALGQAPEAAQQGTVWRSYVATYGVEVFSLEGGPWRRITAQLTDLSPSPSGAWFAYASQHDGVIWTDADKVSEVGVVDTASLATLHKMQIQGEYVYSAVPSLTDTNLLLAIATSFDRGQPAFFVFYDVAAQRELKRIPGVGAIAWLTGNRYLRIARDGTMYTGSLTADETQTGKLTLPTGATPGAFTVNPQGTRIAIRLQQQTLDSTSWDIWVADVDGSHLERFTKTTVSSVAFWSPDGRYLLFNRDADLRCGALDLACDHTVCELHYAPESARELVVNKMSPLRPHALNEQGGSIYVPCFLRGWTANPKP